MAAAATLFVFEQKLPRRSPIELLLADPTTTTMIQNDKNVTNYQSLYAAAKQQLERVRTRPSTVMADEFFSVSSSSSSNHWQTLPQRLARLCHQLQTWVSLFLYQ